jgi:hypothetical protein
VRLLPSWPDSWGIRATGLIGRSKIPIAGDQRNVDTLGYGVDDSSDRLDGPSHSEPWFELPDRCENPEGWISRLGLIACHLNPAQVACSKAVERRKLRTRTLQAPLR